MEPKRRWEWIAGSLILAASLTVGVGALYFARQRDRATRNLQAFLQGNVLPGTTIVVLPDDNARYVADLLAAGADANAWNDSWTTPLIQAAGTGNRQTARLLIDHGARVDQVVAENQPGTALISAAAHGDLAMVDLLLGRRATVDLPDGGGGTALTAASSYGHIAVVRRLLSVGANPNRVDPDGDTPLTDAAEAGRDEVVKLLLDAGADPTHRNNARSTALDVARENGKLGAVRLLLTAQRERSKPRAVSSPH